MTEQTEDERNLEERNVMLRGAWWTVVAGVGAVLAQPLPARGTVVDFEDLALSASGTFYNGNPGGLVAGDSHDGSFASGGATFSNGYAVDADYGYGYWWGFAYSNVQNSTDGSWTNQYAAKPGGGFGGAGTYAVGYIGPVGVAFPAPVTVSGFRAANTTYTYAVMTETDPNGFSTPLSASNGWLKLSVVGSLGGVGGSTVEMYLADYRTAGSPGALASWAWLDLTPLGTVDALSFSITGSDNDPIFGLNTPAYFAMDNLTYAVPEPSALCLLACAGGVLRWRMLRRARTA